MQEVSVEVTKKKRKRKEKKDDLLNSFSQVIEPEEIKNGVVNVAGSNQDYENIISSVKAEKKRKNKVVKQELED